MLAPVREKEKRNGNRSKIGSHHRWNSFCYIRLSLSALLLLIIIIIIISWSLSSLFFFIFRLSEVMRPLNVISFSRTVRNLFIDYNLCILYYNLCSQTMLTKKGSSNNGNLSSAKYIVTHLSAQIHTFSMLKRDSDSKRETEWALYNESIENETIHIYKCEKIKIIINCALNHT